MEQNTPQMTHDEMIYLLKGMVFGTFDRTTPEERVALNMAIDTLEQEPKMGHWIRVTNGAMKEKYICSECGRQIEDDGIEGLLSIKYPYSNSCNF